MLQYERRPPYPQVEPRGDQLCPRLWLLLIWFLCTLDCGASGNRGPSVQERGKSGMRRVAVLAEHRSRASSPPRTRRWEPQEGQKMKRISGHTLTDSRRVIHVSDRPQQSPPIGQRGSRRTEAQAWRAIWRGLVSGACSRSRAYCANERPQCRSHSHSRLSRAVSATNTR